MHVYVCVCVCTCMSVHVYLLHITSVMTVQIFEVENFFSIVGISVEGMM
jgi:hypothetical protein